MPRRRSKNISHFASPLQRFAFRVFCVFRVGVSGSGTHAKNAGEPKRAECWVLPDLLAHLHLLVAPPKARAFQSQIRNTCFRLEWRAPLKGWLTAPTLPLEISVNLRFPSSCYFLFLFFIIAPACFFFFSYMFCFYFLGSFLLYFFMSVELQVPGAFVNGSKITNGIWGGSPTSLYILHYAFSYLLPFYST